MASRFLRFRLPVCFFGGAMSAFQFSFYNTQRLRVPVST
jgi:hypothetical protein